MARLGRSVGFTFTETMGGFVADGAADYRDGAERGRAAGDDLRFNVRVTIDDLGSFIRDPDHRAALSGTVESKRFGAARPIESGVFNLFKRDESGRMAMRYNILFADTAGRRYRLDGFKDVHNDRIVDLWADTTTLFTTVRRADEPGEPILSRGILWIRAIDLVPQVASMRGLHAPGIGAHGVALARFGAFFSGRLWYEYARLPARG
jgi:cholesterol oxidase